MLFLLLGKHFKANLVVRKFPVIYLASPLQLRVQSNQGVEDDGVEGDVSGEVSPRR